MVAYKKDAYNYHLVLVLIVGGLIGKQLLQIPLNVEADCKLLKIDG